MYLGINGQFSVILKLFMRQKGASALETGRLKGLFLWWAGQDLNLRPPAPPGIQYLMVNSVRRGS